MPYLPCDHVYFSFFFILLLFFMFVNIRYLRKQYSKYMQVYDAFFSIFSFSFGIFEYCHKIRSVFEMFVKDLNNFQEVNKIMWKKSVIYTDCEFSSKSSFLHSIFSCPLHLSEPFQQFRLIAIAPEMILSLSQQHCCPFKLSGFQFHEFHSKNVDK